METNAIKNLVVIIVGDNKDLFISEYKSFILKNNVEIIDTKYLFQVPISQRITMENMQIKFVYMYKHQYKYFNNPFLKFQILLNHCKKNYINKKNINQTQ